MTTPITQDPARAERAMRKIKQLQADAAEIAEAIENLKDVVAANLPAGETVLGDEDNGYLKAVIYRSKQFNEAYGKKNAPKVWADNAVAKLTLDSTTAKKVLSPEEYELFQKPSEKMSVKVETVND